MLQPWRARRQSRCSIAVVCLSPLSLCSHQTPLNSITPPLPRSIVVERTTLPTSVGTLYKLSAMAQLPSVDTDSSMCSHLRQLVERRRTPSGVKTEPGETASSGSRALEKRYTSVVQWGAMDQGIKRRKVSAVHHHGLLPRWRRPSGAGGGQPNTGIGLASEYAPAVGQISCHTARRKLTKPGTG